MSHSTPRKSYYLSLVSFFILLSSVSNAMNWNELSQLNHLKRVRACSRFLNKFTPIRDLQRLEAPTRRHGQIADDYNDSLVQFMKQNVDFMTVEEFENLILGSVLSESENYYETRNNLALIFLQNERVLQNLSLATFADLAKKYLSVSKRNYIYPLFVRSQFAKLGVQDIAHIVAAHVDDESSRNEIIMNFSRQRMNTLAFEEIILLAKLYPYDSMWASAPWQILTDLRERYAAVSSPEQLTMLDEEIRKYKEAIDRRRE